MKPVFVVTTLLLINFTLITLLYRDMHTKKSKDTQGLEEVAQIYYKTNDVKRKLSRSIVWEAVETQDPLYLRDSILTLDQSEAIIKFKSGSEIELSPNSLVVLDITDNSFAVNFVKGNIFTKSAGSSIKIKMQNQEFNLNNAKASISNKNISVLSGKINIGKKEINEGESGTIGESGLNNIEKSPFIILAPKPNEKFLSPLKKSKFQISWKPLKSIKTYKIDIAKDPEFTNIVVSKNILHKTSASFELEEGIYVFRISAVVRKKRIYSQSQQFSLIFEEPTKIVTPKQDSFIKYKNEKPLVHIKWIASKLQKNFILEISKNKKFTQHIYRKNLTRNEARIKIASGKYYFRVLSFNPHRKDPLKTNIQSFSVIKLKDLSIPSLQSPADQHVYFPRANPQEKISFSWDTVPRAKAYKLIICLDDKCKNRKFEKEIIESKFNNKMLNEGKYFWSVLAVDELNLETPPEKIRSFRVVESPLITLLAPASHKPIYLMNHKQNIMFKWEINSSNNSYKLLISEDKTFSIDTNSTTTNNSEYSKKDLKPGMYYWKILEYNKNNELINTSQVAKLKVQNYPYASAPFLNFPRKNARLEYFKDRQITFRWKKTNSAKKYNFTLFHKEKSSLRPIIQKEINENYFVTSLPKIGNYQWVVQAIDEQGIPGKKGRNRNLRIIPERRLKAPKGFKIQIIN